MSGSRLCIKRHSLAAKAAIGAGVVHTQQNALLAVAEATNRPIFIDVESQLGYGGVGGFIESLVLRAQETARLALRILDGESAAQIPVAKVNLTNPIFDWRELRGKTTPGE
jgi:hypothetical protein